MANIIRYNVHAPLGDGGSRVGQFKTLDEARIFVGGKDMSIWKAWYCRTPSGKYRIAHQVAIK